MPKKIKDFIEISEVLKASGNLEIAIAGISANSKEIKKGWMFVAIEGSNVDGHSFIDEAIRNGACAISVEKNLENYLEKASCILLVKNSRSFYARSIHKFMDEPAKKIKSIGITGTNGKTTTTYFIYQILNKMGVGCGLISTVEVDTGKKRFLAEMTTPDASKICAYLNEMIENELEYVVMEVSSHALDQHRCDFIPFCGRGFTNITHDHLDYHKDFLSYMKAKKRLFDMAKEGDVCVVNADDVNHKFMIQNCAGNIITYGLHTACNFHAKIIEQNWDGILIKINEKEVWLPVIGGFNVYNALCTVAILSGLGFDENEVLRNLSTVKLPPGRMEKIKVNDFLAIIDYAHTPDGLENVLRELKTLNKNGNLICVFGCAGNRDKKKRPTMGKIAVKYANKVIITSDNPRWENPMEIIQEILQGIDKASMGKVETFEDRKEAIRKALTIAKNGDIVAILGKGHENYQEIKGTKIKYSDKEEVLNFLKANKS